MNIVGTKNQTISFQVIKLMKPETAGINTGKLVEKMEHALGYVEGMKIYSPRKISPLPKRGSRRVVAQIKIKELIG